MPTVGYFVTLQTRENFPSHDYAQAAGTLTNALQATLGNPAVLRSVLRSSEITDPRVEVEISQAEPGPASPIVAHCVVQVESPTKLVFDKNLFTTMVSAELPFPVKISKRAVSKDEHLAATALAEEA